MFLFFFAAISGVCLALFFFSLTSIKTPKDVLYTVNTVEIKNNREITVSTPVSLPRSEGFSNGQYYFPVNNIMQKMDFVIVGDRNEFSFVRNKSGEYIKFVTNTNIAYINDEKCYMPAPSFLDGNNIIYAPLEFLENNFENLAFSFDEKNKDRITVDVGNIKDSEPCFKIQKTKKLPASQESDAPYFSSEPVYFKADLSDYEIYFNPPAESSDEYLVLINQFNPLDPQDYVPPDLTDLTDTRQDGRATQQLRYYPAKALEAFLIEARANGISGVTVTSAYRSFAFQSQLFNDEAARVGSEDIAATSVARPGQSEHQSGLGVDMHTYSSGAAQEFGNTPEGKWLAENAHNFGFILRYAADKIDITGVKYEPWHFRYVGRYHATKMRSLGLCLEEYWVQVLGE